MLNTTTAISARPRRAPAAPLNEARSPIRGRDITTALLSSLLRDVDENALLSLIDECWVEMRAADEQLIEAGHPCAFVYVVLSGKMSVRFADTNSGPDMCLRAGDCAGEMAWIDRLDASASVICTAQARLLVVPKDALWRAVERSHTLAVNLLRVLSRCMLASSFPVDPKARSVQRLRTEAALDPLTRVHNRRWLEGSLPRTLARHERGDRPVCAIMLDIDRFKAFNDAHGHLAGDALLREIAVALRGSLRRNDVVARYGGEEFAIILPDTRIDSAQRMAERMRATVEQLSVPSEGSASGLRATVSIGVAERERGEPAQGLLRRAEQALGAAKQAGRNCVRPA
jgi:diguanylate cyclase (GGDEF)-like protein